MIKHRTVGLAVGVCGVVLVLQGPLVAGGADAAEWKLVFPGETPTLLNKAAEHLRSVTRAGDRGRRADDSRREIVVEMEDRFENAAGREGFVIQTKSDARITVQSATLNGAANGLYAMARRLSQEAQNDPFAVQWDMQERPRFEERGIWLLDFLTQYTHLTVDGFTVEDWKAYIDFLRANGANVIGVASVKYYSPAVPETDRYRPFYENMREAVRYAHEMGMQFHFAMPNNTVPSEVWWENPDLRAKTWGYRGQNLCPHYGLERIREAQRPFLEFVKEIDSLAYMFVDGGSDCHCAYCDAHRADVILDSLNMARGLLAEVGSAADVRAFSWMLDRRKGDLLEQVASAAPADVSFVDSNVELPFFPSGRAGYTVIKQMNRKVSNFVFLTDPEGGMETELSVFPFPRIAETQAELERSRREKVDGILAYRMAPAMRYISDNVVLRLAWNPEADTRQIVDDVVAEWVSSPVERAALSKAIWSLEDFWETMNIESLREAERLFAEAGAADARPSLRRTAEGVHVLLAVAELALNTKKQPTMNDAKAIFELMSGSEIFQGYTTDQAWMGRSQRVVILPMLSEWVSHLRQRAKDSRKKAREREAAGDKSKE